MSERGAGGDRPSTPDLEVSPGSPASPAAVTFEEIYRSSSSYVLRLLWRLGIPSNDLQDVSNEVFLVVHRRLQDYDGRVSAKAWVGGIASNIAMRYRDRASNQREQPAEEEEDLAPVDPGLDAEQLTAQAETTRLVRRLIQGIQLDRRVVFIMYDLDGIDMRDVARTLQISPNTAWDRLKRARRDFVAAVKRLNPRDREALGLGNVRFAAGPWVLSQGGRLLDLEGDPPAAAPHREASVGAGRGASLADDGAADRVDGASRRLPPPAGDIASPAAAAGQLRALPSALKLKLAAGGAALLVAGAGLGVAAVDIVRPRVGVAPPAIELARDGAAGSPSASTSVAPSTDVRVAPATPPAASSAVGRGAKPADARGDDAEATMLGRADAAIGAGKAIEALDVLERHARRYPRSANAERREALTIRALALAGRPVDAAARAERFRAAFPDSVFGPLVEAALRAP